MAIRLQGGFASVKQQDVYVFNIHDSSYASTVIDFDLAQDGIIEEYNQEDKGRNQTILTSSVEIKLLVKKSAIEDFIEDVANAAEGRFLLEVLKNGNKYWYGYILPDQFTLNDLPHGLNPVLKIRATDGIGRLKDIDYNNDGASYTGKSTFLDHLFNILGKITLSDFYGPTESYLMTYVDWWDQNQVYATTSDPFDLSRFDHRALINIDNSGETVYSSAFEVLEQIVKSWNCRFLFSDGMYRLIQINSYKTSGGTKVLKVYDKNKGPNTVSTNDFSIWDKSTGLLNGFEKGTYNCFHNKGNYKYYPALRETEVQYEHFSTENLIPGYTWTEAANPTATFNDVDFNNGSARLYLTATLESRSDWQGSTDFETLTYRYKIQIKVGNYYLHRNFSFVGGKVIYQGYFWSTVVGHVNYFTKYMVVDDLPRTERVEIPPTPVLEEGGQLDVSITYDNAYNNQGQIVQSSISTYTYYYTWANVYMGILVDGNLQDQTNVKVYNSTNDNGSTNSKKEVLKVLVGDGPSSSTFGAIEVYNSSGEWEKSTGWRKGGSGTYREFGQLLSNEILAGQKVAIKRYFGEVTGDYVAHGRLRRYAGQTITNYVFIGGRHNLHQDVWAGEWFIIDVDSTGITSETPKDFTSVIRPPAVKYQGPPEGLRDFFDTLDETPVVTSDPNESSPVNILVDGHIPKDTEISTIPVIVIESDGYIYDGDIINVITPSGEVIQVQVVGDVKPGDTTIDIIPVTPEIDIPEGSIISVPTNDLFAYIQRSRRKRLTFFSDIRVTDTIGDGNPLFFFRVDEASDLYLRDVKQVEIQVYTPGVGSGTYDFELKKDATNILSSTVSETTDINRVTFNYNLTNGLYSFHISNITGTTPIGVNFFLWYVDPIQNTTFIDPDTTINGEFDGDIEARVGGVLSGELYNMTITNYHGMPWGLVIMQTPPVAYPSDADATTVGDDEWYAVSSRNEYGVKPGAIRIKNYTGTSYSDDSAAATGGVSIGEYYVLSIANPYGLYSGFLKLRKS